MTSGAQSGEKPRAVEKGVRHTLASDRACARVLVRKGATGEPSAPVSVGTFGLACLSIPETSPSLSLCPGDARSAGLGFRARAQAAVVRTAAIFEGPPNASGAPSGLGSAILARPPRRLMGELIGKLLAEVLT